MSYNTAVHYLKSPNACLKTIWKMYVKKINETKKGQDNYDLPILLSPARKLHFHRTYINTGHSYLTFLSITEFLHLFINNKIIMLQCGDLKVKSKDMTQPR